MRKSADISSPVRGRFGCLFGFSSFILRPYWGEDFLPSMYAKIASFKSVLQLVWLNQNISGNTKSFMQFPNHVESQSAFPIQDF